MTPEDHQSSTSTTHSPPTTPKWFNSPFTFHTGTLADIRSFMPEFERRTFALTQPGGDNTRLNERLDMIVRKPCGEDPSFIPVGVLSREYSLVQHTDVLDIAAKALEEAKPRRK